MNRKIKTISDAVGKELVAQYSREMSNYLLYRQFANHYYLQGYEELGDYYMIRSEEEVKHASIIFDYLTVCDFPIQFTEIPIVTPKIKDAFVDPIKLTVDKEIETTMDLLKILEMAISEKDYMTEQWLKEGLLMIQQLDEEPESRTALDIAEDSHSSNLRKQQTIRNLLSGQAPKKYIKAPYD